MKKTGPGIEVLNIQLQLCLLRRLVGRIFTLDTEKRKEAKVRKIDANPRMQLVKEIIKILILILIKMLS